MLVKTSRGLVEYEQASDGSGQEVKNAGARIGDLIFTEEGIELLEEIREGDFVYPADMGYTSGGWVVEVGSIPFGRGRKIEGYKVERHGRIDFVPADNALWAGGR